MFEFPLYFAATLSLTGLKTSMNPAKSVIIPGTIIRIPESTSSPISSAFLVTSPAVTDR